MSLRWTELIRESIYLSCSGVVLSVVFATCLLNNLQIVNKIAG